MQNVLFVTVYVPGVTPLAGLAGLAFPEGVLDVLTGAVAFESAPLEVQLDPSKFQLDLKFVGEEKLSLLDVSLLKLVKLLTQRSRPSDDPRATSMGRARFIGPLRFIIGGGSHNSVAKSSSSITWSSCKAYTGSCSDDCRMLETARDWAIIVSALLYMELSFQNPSRGPARSPS
jgi:hypothetical protein